MRKLFIILILFPIAFWSCNRKQLPANNPEEGLFPDNWNGFYAGQMLLSRNGMPPDTMKMALKIFRLDIERSAFYINYNNDSVWREYELTPGRQGNHFIMDEKNSILLDHYFQNNELSSTFSVQEKANPLNYSLLRVSYRKDRDTIYSTISTFPMKHRKQSGDSVRYEIQSYREQVNQSAKLVKIQN